MSFVAATAVRFSLAGRDVSMSIMLAILIADFTLSFVVGDLKLFGDWVVGGVSALLLVLGGREIEVEEA